MLLGATFLTLVFVYWPREVLGADWAADWPRWSFRSHPLATVAAGAVGAVLIAAGVALFAYCTLLFDRKGSGTPVPTDPPERLVVSGPFRWSRNPMYIAYTFVLLGEALVFGHTALFLYTAVWVVGFHAMARGEETLLRRRFGERYERYARQVPRWIGLRRTCQD
jgi:protein-S-isoprenylcysteine O-methyltransferase Ste14